MTDAKTIIAHFLSENSLAVISTIGKNTQPESALIAFAETSDLELVFETQAETRKYNNLLQNPNVAFVIGWDSVIHRTLQYEGVASELNAEELSKYLAIFKTKKTPCTDAFLEQPNVKFFKVTPKWISFSDYTGKKPEVLELFF